MPWAWVCHNIRRRVKSALRGLRWHTVSRETARVPTNHAPCAVSRETGGPVGRLDTPVSGIGPRRSAAPPHDPPPFAQHGGLDSSSTDVVRPRLVVKLRRVALAFVHSTHVSRETRAGSHPFVAYLAAYPAALDGLDGDRSSPCASAAPSVALTHAAARARTGTCGQTTAACAWTWGPSPSPSVTSHASAYESRRSPRFASQARSRAQPFEMTSRSRTASPELRTVSVRSATRGSVPRRRGPRDHARRCSRSARAMPSRMRRRALFARRCAHVSHHAPSPHPTGNAWTSPHREHHARTCRRCPHPSRRDTNGSVSAPARLSCHASRVRSRACRAILARSRWRNSRSSRQLARARSRAAHSSSEIPQGFREVTVVPPSTSPRGASGPAAHAHGSTAPASGERPGSPHAGLVGWHRRGGWASGSPSPGRPPARLTAGARAGGRATGAARPHWGRARPQPPGPAARRARPTAETPRSRTRGTGPGRRRAPPRPRRAVRAPAPIAVARRRRAPCARSRAPEPAARTARTTVPPTSGTRTSRPHPSPEARDAHGLPPRVGRPCPQLRRSLARALALQAEPPRLQHSRDALQRIDHPLDALPVPCFAHVVAHPFRPRPAPGPCKVAGAFYCASTETLPRARAIVQTSARRAQATQRVRRAPRRAQAGRLDEAAVAPRTRPPSPRDTAARWPPGTCARRRRDGRAPIRGRLPFACAAGSP